MEPSLVMPADRKGEMDGGGNAAASELSKPLGSPPPAQLPPGRVRESW